MDSTQKGTQEVLVIKNGQQIGPYSKEEVLTMVKNREISIEDMVWQAPLENWRPIREHFTYGELATIDNSKMNTTSVKNPHESSNALGKQLGFHPTVATLAIIVDIMVFILSIPTLGIVMFSVILLSIITFLIQKNQYGDTIENAFTKTLMIALLTGIPVPLCTALILYFKYFGKK